MINGRRQKILNKVSAFPQTRDVARIGRRANFATVYLVEQAQEVRHIILPDSRVWTVVHPLWILGPRT